MRLHSHSKTNNRRRKAHDLGLRAEMLAALYLQLKGYRIIARRYRNHYGEIDLLAVRGKWLVAVEVKARKAIAQCADSVPYFKQQKIASAMAGLTAERSKIAGLAQAERRNIRYDVIYIVPGHFPRHVKGAWGT